MNALMGSCNEGAADYEVTGTVTSGDTIYTVIISFGSNAPAAGNYTTVYTGSGSAGLTAGQCRIELDLMRISDNWTQLLRAKANASVTLTTAGANKYKASFGTTDFVIQLSGGGGSAVRTASSTPFGCE
jgi:hypothetical protein